MPVDNRHFIIEDLPDDPISLTDDDDDDDLDDSPSEEDYLENLDRVRRQREDDARPSFQTPQTPIWSQRPMFNTPRSPWSTPTYSQPSSFQSREEPRYNQRGSERIDRRKKVIFVDLLDILIESESALSSDPGNFNKNNNYRRIGVMPRGLYDIRLKLEVWSKIAAFSPDYVFCITNQPKMEQEKLAAWDVMIKYVMYSLAEYLRLPYDNCRCLTKFGYQRQDDDVKPGLGLMKRALSLLPQDYTYSRENLVVIGSNSGYSNQGDQDRKMAYNAQIDYVDVWDLLVSYN